VAGGVGGPVSVTNNAAITTAGGIPIAVPNRCPGKFDDEPRCHGGCLEIGMAKLHVQQKFSLLNMQRPS
jgi:hypothetical protein